jgi:hypothetical protein
MSRYANVEAFYADDELRRRSPELDFGVWWRAAGVVYRLTWVEATGELVAVQLTPARAIPFHVLEDNLERVHVPREYAERLVDAAGLTFGVAVVGGEAESVTVLGVVQGRDAVERLLDGWADVCGAPDSVEWVVGRVNDAGLEAP